MKRKSAARLLNAKDLLAFAESKGDSTYDFINSRYCFFAQYFRSHGFDVEHGGPFNVSFADGTIVDLGAWEDFVLPAKHGHYSLNYRDYVPFASVAKMLRERFFR